MAAFAEGNDGGHGEGVDTEFNGFSSVFNPVVIRITHQRCKSEWDLRRLRRLRGRIAFVKDCDRITGLIRLRNTGTERDRDDFIRWRIRCRITGQIVQEEAVVEPEEQRRRVVVGDVIKLRPTGIAVVRRTRRIRRSVGRVVVQFHRVRRRRFKVDRRQAVNVDRAGRAIVDLQVIRLALNDRNPNSLVGVARSVFVAAKVRNQIAIRIVGKDVQVTVSGQTGTAVGQRSLRLEEDLHVQRAGGQGNKLVPILVTGDSHRSRTGIDQRINVQRRTRSQVGGIEQLIVCFQQIRFEGKQSARAPSEPVWPVMSLTGMTSNPLDTFINNRRCSATDRMRRCDADRAEVGELAK